MNIEAWRAPEFQLSLDNLPVWNAIFSHASVPLPLGSSGKVVMFAPQPEPRLHSGMHRLYHDDEPFGYLRVNAFPFASYGLGQIDVTDLKNLPADLEEALRDGMHASLLSMLADKLGERFRLVPMDVALSPQHAMMLQWFDCTVSDPNDAAISFVFGANPNAICAQAIGFAPSVRHMDPSLNGEFPLAVKRIVGIAKLTVADMRELVPGDCILFLEIGSSEEQCFLLGDQVRHFEKCDEGWMCNGAELFDDMIERATLETFEMNDMSADQGEEFDDLSAGQDAIAELPLTILFTLGAANLSIGEIETWQAGSVVLLPEKVTSDDTQVTISANGKVLALGDLVRLQDRLAVRVSRLRFDPENPHT